ncbi:putative enzyme [groundwater metagenome]|uniref:Putative enzyme n=1 Tax=groundwater metagenome TaxID=717931 RepID=A0A098E6L8_9ZZZZ
MENFSIILVEPIYGGNIGSVARVMMNFGFKNLVMVNPPLIGIETIKFAVHAKEIVQDAKIFKSFDEMSENFDLLIGTSAGIAGDKNFIRTPISSANLGNVVNVDGNIGLVFGREDFGLSDKEIEKCDILVTIPTDRSYKSLNLSHSVAVILYELAREKNLRGVNLKKMKLANKIERDVMLEKFTELVSVFELGEFRTRLIKKTFKIVTGRSFVSGRECNTLTGVFRRSRELIEKQKKENTKGNI